MMNKLAKCELLERIWKLI